MSEGRAIINIIGNTIATVIIAKSEKALDMDTYRMVVEKKKTKLAPGAPIAEAV